MHGTHWGARPRPSGPVIQVVGHEMMNWKRTIACCFVAPLGAFAGWFLAACLAVPANLAMRWWSEEGQMGETGWDIFLFSLFTIGGIAAGAGFAKAGLKVHPEASPRFILSILAVFALVVFIPVENDTPLFMLTGVWLAMLLGGALGIMETKRRCPTTNSTLSAGAAEA